MTRILFRSPDKGSGVLVEPIDALGERFDEFRGLQAGAVWNHAEKEAVAPPETAMRIMQRLTDAGFTVVMTPNVRAMIETEVAALRLRLEIAEQTLKRVEADLAKRGKKLYPFQREDVLWLTTRKAALNCNEPGLGKTLETLCMLPPPGNTGVLVCGPVIAKSVWRDETTVWRPEYRATVLSGSKGFRFPEPGELVACNFEMLPAKMDGIAPPRCKVFLVVDEAHYAKNKKSIRTRRIDMLKAYADRFILLTGTPLPNKPEDLWNLLCLAGVAHEAYGSMKGFLDAFGGTVKKIPIRPKVEEGQPLPPFEEWEQKFAGYEWGAPRPDAGERLSRVMVRHRKIEVIHDLPERSHRTIYVEINNALQKKINAAIDPELERTILAAKDISDIPFERLSDLRSFLASAKLEAATSLAENFEEMEEPVVFFSMHREVVDVLSRRPMWRLIAGGVSEKERDEAKSLFQAGKLRGIAATIQAAGTALTLTRSMNAVFIDKSYRPADNEQAEDRLIRIGQKNAVLITHLVCDHAIDRHVHELLQKKRTIINASVEKVERSRPVDLEKWIPKLPDRSAGVVDASMRARAKTVLRAPKNEEEKQAASILMVAAGLTGGRCIMSGDDKKLGLKLGGTLLATGTLEEKHWKIAKWLGKQYSRRVAENAAKQART